MNTNLGECESVGAGKGLNPCLKLAQRHGFVRTDLLPRLRAEKRVGITCQPDYFIMFHPSFVSFQKSIAQWRALVDVNQWEQRPYVVVDPLDPEGLLYLTESEYTDLSRTWIRSNLRVKVVARPSTVFPRTQPSDSDSPYTNGTPNGSKESPPPTLN
jgi:hypothetical protein